MLSAKYETRNKKYANVLGKESIFVALKQQYKESLLKGVQKDKEMRHNMAEKILKFLKLYF